jgi:hypothetical protein
MWGHHVSEQRAGEPMRDDIPGRDESLERRLAQLAEEFDPVPSSVIDEARAALSARTKDRATKNPESGSEDSASEDSAMEDVDRVPGPRDS